jgi:hypothetical protein
VQLEKKKKKTKKERPGGWLLSLRGEGFFFWVLVRFQIGRKG